jgi:phosphate acetyltransferase
MSIFGEFVERARARPAHIVLAEGEDERILAAAVKAKRDGIARITVLGSASAIEARARQLDLSLKGIHIVDPAFWAESGRFADELFHLRAHKGMTLEDARARILDPLTLANMMTRLGYCDGTVAGAVYSTSDVVRTALQLIGKQDSCDLVSSFFIMVFERPFHPDLSVMVFADCALVVEPGPRDLAQIAIVSADSARDFVGLVPRLAMLSFSTDGSAGHPLVDKVTEARALVGRLRPELEVAGDIQLDAALVPEILQRKSKNMRFHGPANVLIFPGLESGNIGYKLVERFAGAEAIGPILQGLNKPANDLSRGCSVEDIYKIITVTVVQAISQKTGD